MTDKETEVKRFVAPTMSKALELVREEMGPEAIILSSQKVSGGIEIVTSIERDLTTRGIDERRHFGQKFDSELDHAMESDVSWQSQAGIEQAAAKFSSRVELNGPSEKPQQKRGEELAAEIERARGRMLEAKRRAANESESSRISNAKPADRVAKDYKSDVPKQSHVDNTSFSEKKDIESEKKLEDLKGEIADLRMLLEQQLWQKTAVSELPKNAFVETPAPSHRHILSEHLAHLGLVEELRQRLLSEINPKMRLSDSWKHSLSKLAYRIPISDQMDTKKGGKFAFIGPTGVGKTTTIAKLASQYTLANGPGKVALVSMDTHRVGAAEQLKALGRILDAPVRTLPANTCLMTTLVELKDFPLVLIDTAGFRHGDALLKMQLDQLDQNPSVKRLLVLSSLSQLQNIKASIHAYRPRKGRDACVISKLDEASSLGEVISAVIQHEIPVAYLTDGQHIPTDAHIATRKKLIGDMVLLAKQTMQLSSALI